MLLLINASADTNIVKSRLSVIGYAQGRESFDTSDCVKSARKSYVNYIARIYFLIYIVSMSAHDENIKKYIYIICILFSFVMIVATNDSLTRTYSEPRCSRGGSRGKKAVYTFHKHAEFGTNFRKDK